MTTMLTVTEVAERLKVSPQTVRRWAAAGQLPAARLPGGRLRFDPGAIEVFLERQDAAKP